MNVDYTGGVEYTTLAEIFATSGGEGTYNIKDLLVYAKNNNSAILGDAAGVKILLYKSGHGLNVGETVDVTNAVIGTYNDNIQITNGTFTVKSTGTAVDHGNPWNLNEATTVAELPDESNFFSPIYAVMTGAQNGRVITGGTTLYLDVANAATDGKKVIFEGYVCSYEKANTRHRVLAIDLQERMTVSPTSLSWKADETDAKTITVVINDGGDGYTVTPTTDTNFTISDNGSGTITVTPKAKNTSTTDAKSVTLTITHKNDADVQATVTCTQAKKSSGSTPDPVTVSTFANTANVEGTGVGQTATWTSGDITITAEKMVSSATAFRSTDEDHVRFYKDWKVTVSSAAYTISSVEFTCTSADYATTLSGYEFSAGTAAASGSVVTVSDVNAASTNVTLGAQVRVTSITVNYE